MAKDIHLVDERTKYKKLWSDAYPDVGMGPWTQMLRREAIEELKKEGKIAADYTEPE